MTTYPTSPLAAIGADGAFEIGGGAFDFGQGYTENLIKNMFEVPMPTSGNAVEVLTQQLSRLPLEALQYFKQIIPGTVDDDFIDVAASVTTVIANLSNLPKGLLTGDFNQWVSGTFDPVSTEVRQLLEILGGLTVTPINSAVQGVKDWWTSINQQAQSNTARTDNLIDAATNALSGASIVGQEVVGAGLDLAKTTMEQLFGQVSKVTRDVQALQSESTAAATGGRRFNIDFSNYANGPFPSGLFNLTYTGAGTSTLIIKDGNAVWNLVNDGDRDAILIYPTPTLTPYQIVGGTMSSPPEGSNSGQKPRIWAVARSNAAGTDYVFARGYNTGFMSYKGDIGCVKGGVEYIWASNVPLTWSLDIRVVCGVGNNPRRHQVLSGNTIVIDLIEPAAKQSVIDADHCYWGSQSETNGVNSPGAVAGASVVDNAPPDVIGTTFRASRRSGADITWPSGGAKAPTNFFETIDYQSPDVKYEPGTNCRVTVQKQGTYLVQYRALHGPYAQGTGGHGLLYKNGSPYERGQWGSNAIMAGFGVNATTEDATSASFVVPLNPGDYIEPGFHFTSSMSNTGDAAKMADGSQTWFAVTRVGIA